MTKLMKDLRHDCAHLYFLIGAITDAIAQLPPAAQQQCIEALQQKAARTENEYRESIDNLIEALKK